MQWQPLLFGDGGGEVGFFGERFGVDVEHLPSKRYRARDSNGSTERYFVDKFPIGVEQGSDNESRVVFTYVDDGDHGTSGLRRTWNSTDLSSPA